MSLMFSLTMLLSYGATAQTARHHYQFKVEWVNDLAAAKEMTDFIRPVFNTAQEPFGYFPYFNANTGQFDFISAIAVTEDELRNVLDSHSLVLLSFSDSKTEQIEVQK